MKRTIVLIISILFTIVCFKCYKPDSTTVFNSEKFRDRLIEIVDSSNHELPTLISFNDITNFEWNSLNIFTSYTPISEINRRLGFEWSYAKYTGIDYEDTFNLIVFSKNNEVVAFVKHPRNKGDFKDDDVKRSFSQKNSMFKLKQEDYGFYKRLMFYPISSK